MIISLGREQFIKIENYKENLKINIFDIIEKKKEIIIKDFINQFYKICYNHKIKKKSLIQNYIEKSGINLLVISDFYEKNIWKNKEIKDIFILLALKRFISLDKSLTISGKIQLSPTFFYLKSLNKIKLTNLVIIKKNNKNLNSAIWILLKFLKQAVFNVPFLILCSKKNFKVNDVVFSYSTFIDGKKNKDFYWKNIEKINISPDYYKLIINIPSHISNINKISFANSSERIIFLESYQNLATLSKSIYLWLKLRFYLKNKNFF